MQFQHCHSVSMDAPCWWSVGGRDPREAFAAMQKKWGGAVVESIPAPPEISPEERFALMKERSTDAKHCDRS